MRRNAGFTLLETLVAMVLMSLLLIALFGSFRAGVASWRLADEHVDKMEPQLMLSRMLYRHMSQLRIAGTSRFSFRSTVWSSERQGVFYLAKVDVLRYVAPLGQAVDNQLYLVELRSRAGSQPGVWMKAVPYDEKNNDEMLAELDKIEAEQVSRSVEIRFSYLLETEWLNELPDGAQPVLLKVDWLSPGRTWASTTYRIVGR